MLMLTTTAIDVDQKLRNRCLVLTVNESRSRRKPSTRRSVTRRRWKDCWRRMRKKVTSLSFTRTRSGRCARSTWANPFASQLTFMSDKTRTRRDHMKYLTLIQAHRAAAPVPAGYLSAWSIAGQAVEYIEVAREDIALANRLAHEILGRTLMVRRRRRANC